MINLVVDNHQHIINCFLTLTSLLREEYSQAQKTSSFRRASARLNRKIKAAKNNIRLEDERIEQLKEDLRKLQVRAQKKGLSLRSN